MNKRNYNIFFHLHTVSGISISVILFVIFFCGAFALFKDEVAVWEKGQTTQQVAVKNIDFDKAIKVMQKKYNLAGRDVRMIMPDVRNEMLVILSESKYPNAAKKDKEEAYFYLNVSSFEVSEYYSFYSLGELIYRFHFLSPIPYGIYIAGFTAFIFLFAIITGVFVHWKKIISNFYVFRPTAKLKNIWTDAHTALGMIGLPFQAMYALTSSFLCLSILVLIPANYFYNNNQTKLIEDLRPMTKSYPLQTKISEAKSFNPFVENALQLLKGFEPEQVYVKNFGDASMKFQLDGFLEPQDKLLSYGSLVYDVPQNKIIATTNPYEINYLENVEATVQKLHFGDFGGYWLKATYFILAMITCFVIISGVLIWLEARNKKNIPEKEMRYNQRVGHIYMSLCLAIFPATALSFIVSKLIPLTLVAQRQNILYVAFFGGWLLLALFFFLKKNHYFTNKYTLWMGAVLGLCIPILNGFQSGNWMWKTAALHQTPIFVVDLLWMGISVIAFFVISKLPAKNHFVKS